MSLAVYNFDKYNSSIYENSELNVYESMKFLGEISNNL